MSSALTAACIACLSALPLSSKPMSGSRVLKPMSGCAPGYADMHGYAVGVFERLFVEVGGDDVEVVHGAGEHCGHARLLVGNLFHLEPVEVGELRAGAVAGRLAARDVILEPVQDYLVAGIPAYEHIRAGGYEILGQFAGGVCLDGLFGHDVGLGSADVAERGHQQGGRLAEFYGEGLVVNGLEAYPDVVEHGGEGLVPL